MHRPWRVEQRLHDAPALVHGVLAIEARRIADHRRVQEHLVGRRALTSLRSEFDVERDLARACGIAPVRVELEAHARCRIQLDHDLVGFGVVVDVREAEAGRPPEDEPQLGLRDRQALARADEEGHARPAPVLDLEPQGTVGLGRGVGRHAVDGAVAVVLAAHVVSGIGLVDRPERGELSGLDRLGIASRRRLHDRHGDDLHEVVDDDVAEGAYRVVEVPAILDAEVLSHRDLHARDEVAVPDRLEDRVREA